MSTKKNTTVYKKNKKTSKYGVKKSRKTTTRTKKGGAIPNHGDAIGTEMTAGQLYNIGRTLRWPQGQEAGVITKIEPAYNGSAVRVYFQTNDPNPDRNSYQGTTDTVINNNEIVYIE